MPKTITVKGIGKASAKPDYVVLFMTLESKDSQYEKAIDTAAENIDLLNKSLEEVGFEKDSLKTTNFNVNTDYETNCDENGKYIRVFKGYVVKHDLKIEFDLDSKRLDKALSAVGSCPAHPQLNISFTVKDAAAINEEMLRSAADNAKRKAKILCEASGVEIGNLLSIDYNWGELNIYSDTEYKIDEDCMYSRTMAKSIEIEPDNIDVSDTATFVWEIN